MKKTLILSFILILGAMVVKASNPILDSGRGPYWGIRVGWDYSMPGKWKFDNGNTAKMYKPGSGFTVGAVYNLPVVANLYFEPGLTLYYDTYSFDGIILGAENNTEASPKIKKFGFLCRSISATASTSLKTEASASSQAPNSVSASPTNTARHISTKSVTIPKA